MKQKLIGIALGLGTSIVLGVARDTLKDRAIDKTPNRNIVPILIFVVGGIFYLVGDSLDRKIEAKFPTDQ